MVLRGAGGFMLGLPLLETFMPRKASAQTAVRSPFVLIVVGDNGVVQAGVSLSVSSEPEKFWPTTTGTLTKASMTTDKASRSTGELADYAEQLLIVRGINLPFSSNAARTRRPTPRSSPPRTSRRVAPTARPRASRSTRRSPRPRTCPAETRW